MEVEEVTYSQLAAKIANSSLVPSRKYRITDYVATTNGDMSSQSANKPFDIIVTALTNNTLSEEARAIQHAGDTYFANSKLAAWKVWYCFANDSNRFAWATGSGKGVIYRLIDEFGNDVPYDFKGIKFIPYDPNGSGSIYYFTFSTGNGEPEDLSLNANNYIYGNKISPRRYNNKVILNKIVFRGTYCHSNTFGDDCYSTTLDEDCSANAFGNNCYNNTFGDYCSYNTFGNYCYSNTFEDDCYNNTFGNYCSSNTFGDNFQYNTFGDDYSNLNRAASYPMLYAVYGEITTILPKSAFPIEFDHDGSIITYTWDDYRNGEVWIEEYDGSSYVLCSDDFFASDPIASWTLSGVAGNNYMDATFAGKSQPGLMQFAPTPLTPWAVNNSMDEGFGAYQIDVGFCQDEGSRVRDLVWTFDCSDSVVAPEIYWPEKFYPANQDETNLIAEAEAVNVFFVTEVFGGGFIVSRQILPAHANGGSSSSSSSSEDGPFPLPDRRT